MGVYSKQSLQTKKKISRALKRLMNEKNFNNITIMDIIKECKINRNTFYYHFTDIYDLLQWTFKQEAIDVLKQISKTNDLQKAIVFALQYVESNKTICRCAYDSLGIIELQKFFKSDFVNIILQFIDNQITESSFKISDDYKRYLEDIFSDLLALHLINYVKSDKNISINKLSNYILVTFKSALDSSLDFANKNNL